MKTIFLDFDGVLHTSSFHIQSPFSKVEYFEPLLDNYRFDVVVSSTWRFHYKLSEIKLKLKKLGERVIDVTGENFPGTYARYNEIKEYSEFNQIVDWRAVDDAISQFPENETRLIYCDSKIGVTQYQIDLLKKWLES
jgi:hypothetical protein